ncbi:hypothetical protein F5883DRAFT_622484 [Diaporthe sp. PMI_573]|nr:hypothetical protein F5883DRAFT_622484 [Diaporthaceae sp. PMI_573]
MLKYLCDALEHYKNITESLKDDLEIKDGYLSTGHEESLKGLTEVIEYYRKVYDENMSRVEAQSGVDHGSHSNKKGIRCLAADMAACHDTFSHGITFTCTTLSGAYVETDKLVADRVTPRR